jgi:chemotaxis protein CheD
MITDLPRAPSSSRRICVGVGDMAASDEAGAVLSTYALGSCIGVVAYDPQAKAGGILHLMLPDSAILPEKAAAQPAMFADTGLPGFFRLLRNLGADLARLRVLVAGGAHMIMGKDPFRIGESNWRATTDFMADHGYAVHHAEIGGSINRSVALELSSGQVTMRMPGSQRQFNLAAEPEDRTTAYRRAC